VHFVYIVRCADGTLYTGYARDPRARERLHNAGRGARYTSGRRPVSLVYCEVFESIGDALRRERELKRMPRARKEALVSLPSRRLPTPAPAGRPPA
jgi:putative endonuclease